jgi:hypothetical protein
VVEVMIEEMFRSDRNRPRDYETSRGRRARSQPNEQDHSWKWREKSVQKGFDRADIVRDVRLVLRLSGTEFFGQCEILFPTAVILMWLAEDAN